MKKIGFLSFGHWTPSPQSQTRSAADALLQSIELAVAAEQLGADGAYYVQVQGRPTKLFVGGYPGDEDAQDAWLVDLG